MIDLSQEPLSPYDLGHALGRLFSDSFRTFIATAPLWQRLKAASDPDALASMAALTRHHFGDIWAELEGLAAGLDVSFDEVFLWNCRGDFLNFPGDGCTTVVDMAEGSIRLGHNEDGDAVFAGQCRLVRISPQGRPAFWSFCCPGSLAGHTFAMNASGLVQTINNICPARTPTGLPRMVLSRAVLAEDGLDGALDILRRHKTFGGFHHLLASARELRVFSVETAHGTASVERIDRSYAHANHLIHADLAAAPQIVTPSSSDRQRRADALLAETAPGEPGRVRRILCDVEPGRLPILRMAGAPADGMVTLSQALFEITGPDVIRFEVFDHEQRLMAAGETGRLSS